MSTPGLIIACLFFIAGMAGIILPILPSAPLLIVGMLIYGFFEDFTHLTWSFFAGQLILVAFIFAVDYLANIWGVKKYGGSKTAIGGSLIGMFAGLFLLGPLGIILGPLAGAIIGELLAHRSFDQALKSGFGTLLGFLGGAMLKLILQILMIVWFFSVIL
ncbi:DUF456 domain-containing protein [Desulfotomaculum defluvii]